MIDTREKTLHYCRAVWFVDTNLKTLESYIREAHQKLKTVGARKFQRDDGQYLKGLRFQEKKDGGGYFLHVIAETPGDHASTVTTADDTKDASDVDTVPPPNGKEFMDGDVFAFIKGDDTCICSTALRDSSFYVFLLELFKKAKLEDKSDKFELQKVANVDKLKMIKKEGVKEIDIGATLFDASVKYINRKDGMGVFGTVAEHLRAIFKDDGQPKEDSLKVQISIVTDGRMKGQPVGEKRMTTLAEELINGDEPYSILTKADQRITPSEVYVRTRVPIERFGKSVKRAKAWNELDSFYRRLHANGVTAQ